MWLATGNGKGALGSTKGQGPSCTFTYNAASIAWELCKSYI